MIVLLAACRIEIGPPDVAGPGASEDRPAGEVWVYTSMYPSVLDAFDPLLRAELPDVEVHWYQAGSEKVAQRVETEWAAGGSKACLLLTSDPFWYARLKDQGRLAPHLAPNALRLDRSLVDPDGYWVTSRESLMVLAANASVTDPPASFADLADPRFKGRITMPDPLASGTAFTWLSFADWDLVAALHANGLVAAGGNSAVLTRVASGERPVGVLLLENLLSDPGSPVVTVAPQDGAVLIPGPIALTAGCPNPVAAGAVYDLILSPAGQALITTGNMYAALPELAPPHGAPALDAIPVRPWPAGFVEQVTANQAALKDRWAKLVNQ